MAGQPYSLLLLLYLLAPKRWYWHAVSVALAMALGLMPMPAHWQGQSVDLVMGFLFVFFLLWGVSAPLFRTFHRSHG
jgi:thiamine transporter ThiT